MSHGTAPEGHARPGNPLASQSRAVLAFHARRRLYPDGDADRARFVDNERVPGALLEARFPMFDSFKEPVFVDTRIAREAYMRAWIDGDKELDDRDATVATFATSIKCRSVKENDVLAFPGATAWCDGAYDLCNRDPGTMEINHRYDKTITRIPACVAKYTNLRSLNLTGAKVSRIENLDTLVNLTYLNLPGTKVSRIENIDTLVNLEELGLNRTKVSRIENLNNNVKLERLELYGTKVSRIDGLDKNTNLESLDLDRTKVSKIENLDKLVNLKYLDLSGTKVPVKEKRAFKASRPGLIVR